ncbi:MAG: DUF1292 domain-containing protein [Bacillota bacterium]|jgi:hypothetical protein
MTDDKRLVQLYNEEDEQILNFIEYKRLLVQGRLYALLQPEDDLDLLVPFRIEGQDGDEDEEVYIYIVDDEELEAVEEAWQKLHS